MVKPFPEKKGKHYALLDGIYQYVENYGPGGTIRKMDDMNTFFFLLEAEDDE